MITGVLLDGRVTTKAVALPSVLPRLQQGSRGAAVSALQTFLKERSDEDDLEVDGSFGPATQAAVKRFQTKNFLTADGIVDDEIWTVIKKQAVKQVSGFYADISQWINRMEVSLTMDSVSQISIEVSDPGLRLLAANYFNVRRRLTYLGLDMEIAAVEVTQGTAGEIVRLDCRSRAAQRMKRKKGKNLFTGGSSTAYAATQARDFGLSYFGEKTAKKNNIAQSQNGQADESVWSVLQRLANENQFKMFETDGKLFYASQQFLLGKFALVGTDGDDPAFLATPIRWLDASNEDVYEYQARIVGPKGSPRLDLGSTGEHVKFIHDILKYRTSDRAAANERKTISKSTTTNGITRTIDSSLNYFGPKTEKAIKAIQDGYGLKVTGVVDEATWQILRYLAEAKKDIRSQFFVRPLQCPTIRRSDDDYFAATFQCQVDHEIGIQFRPGMTVYFEDIPNFRTNFLITEVAWEEGTDTPVTISGVTPEYPEDKKVREELATRVDMSGGGFANIDYDAALEQPYTDE